MGVAGCGKTTVGRLLSARLGVQFLDADDFHSVENKAKMERGAPLDDADRAPWLRDLASALEGNARAGRSTVLACSALKKSYRQALRVNGSVYFVYLKASPEVLRARLEARGGHYFGPSLLESQFAALEEPEDALTIDAAGHPAVIADAIEDRFDLGMR